jgi:3-oxoacyl-[acyl-carrier-protein] synthase II
MNTPTQPTVVITGLGALSGLGAGADQTWQQLNQTDSAFSIRNDWEISEIGTQYFGRCVPYELKDYVANLKPPFPLKYSQLAMVGCALAIQDADLTGAGLEPERLGLVLDTTFGANAAAESFLFKLFQDGPAKVSPFNFTKTTVNCALGDVARAFTLRGPSSITMGEHSLAYGYDLIRSGKADVVVCGGFDEVREITLWAYDQRGYLHSPYGPDGQLRPFADNLDETNSIIALGEGAGFVVLESKEHALKRQVRIYAELIDYAITCDDAYVDFLYERNPDDLEASMRDVLDRTNVAPAEVGLVVGGGCMPWHIRDFELPVVRKLWGDEPVQYTTVKSKAGETFSASPMLSLLSGVLSLYHKQVPGTGYAPHRLGLTDTDPVQARQSATPYNDRKPYAMVNSLHAGGNTVSVLIKQAA